MSETPALLTPERFGEQIGVSRATVYRYIAQGLITPTHLPNALPGSDGSRGSRVRISIDELARFKKKAEGAA